MDICIMITKVLTERHGVIMKAHSLCSLPNAILWELFINDALDVVNQMCADQLKSSELKLHLT